jgi:hypothetical protein
MSKVGRNKPCPCGSGKKFKKCHGAVKQQEYRSSLPPGLADKFQELKAEQQQQEKQQGLGRPIISTMFNSYRVVAVGDRIYWSNKWKTFHEFLWEYIKSVIGGEWGNTELRKPADQRHPLLNWYEQTTHYINRHIKVRGKVHSIDSIGVVSAYLQLAYSLYLIAHNQKLEAHLIKRLKNPDQFLPAFYEACVFGALIRAGFTLEFEDESDSSTTHCEVTATFAKSGRKFSVEAKMRQASTASLDIGRQLKKALKKKAGYARIVFAEINIPEIPDDNERVDSLEKILADIRKRESENITPDEPLPPAYVVVTNHSFFHFPDRPVGSWALAEGFRISDFGWHRNFQSLREALTAREKHIEMFELMKSWEENYEIPSTFDGAIPEFAFGDGPPRLLIGAKYLIPGHGGYDIVGTLKQAIVCKDNKLCVGFYETEDGKNSWATCPLTDDEISAYERYPETFFGVPQRSQKPARDGLELYDFFYEGYQKNTKPNLLKLLNDASDIESLKKLSQEKLLQIYCERLVTGFLAVAPSFGSKKLPNHTQAEFRPVGVEPNFCS